MMLICDRNDTKAPKVRDVDTMMAEQYGTCLNCRSTSLYVYHGYNGNPRYAFRAGWYSQIRCAPCSYGVSPEYNKGRFTK